MNTHLVKTLWAIFCHESFQLLFEIPRLGKQREFRATAGKQWCISHLGEELVRGCFINFLNCIRIFPPGVQKQVHSFIPFLYTLIRK